MSSQLYTTAEVHTGSWTNWSNGRVQGATLTIPSQNSAYLIAFLALFVRVAGGHFWEILAYILFQARTTAHARDGLYYQQQAILRNTESDTNASWQFLRLAWYWRKRAKEPWARSLSLALTAIANVIAFGAAGIFVSKVATNGHSDVLLARGTCGSWPDPYTTATLTPAVILEDTLYSSMTQTWDTTASLFAADCYGYSNVTSTNVPSEDCRAYGRRLIDWSVKTVAQCPFSEEMCIRDQAVHFDTGYMDSHDHFGINAPPHHRIQTRQLFQCAPIITKGFESGNLTMGETDAPLNDFLEGTSNTSTRYIQYFYGPNAYEGTNATFPYSNNTFGTGFQFLTKPSYLLE